MNEHPATKLCLGTAQFGLDYGITNRLGKTTETEVSRIIDLAKSMGISFVDTAMSYGNSEAALGQTGVKDLCVVTKLGSPPNGVKRINDWVTDQVHSSLKRLNVNSLHGLLLHRSIDAIGDHGVELFAALRYLQDEGVIKKIGVSIYDPSELDTIFGYVPLELVQAPLNLVDRRIETSGWIDRLAAAGCEIHVRSVFLQGLLLAERQTIPRNFERWSAMWDRWTHELALRNVSAATACLAYPLSLEKVDKVLVGVNTHKQLQMIIAALTAKLDCGDWSFMTCLDESLINPTRWTAL